MHPFFDPIPGALQADFISLSQDFSWALRSSHLAWVSATDKAASYLLRDFLFLKFFEKLLHLFPYNFFDKVASFPILFFF
jgi:hypothetical protein